MTDRSPNHLIPPGGHCAPEDLSALLDGEGGRTAAEEIRAHLWSCESCRRRYEQMAEVQRGLRALTTRAPAGAPAAAVAAALDAVRGDAPNQAGSPGDAGSTSTAGTGSSGGGPAAGLTPLRHRQRRVRAAGIAAAVLLVAGGVSEVVLTAGRDSGSSPGAAAGSTASHGASSGRVASPSGDSRALLVLGPSPEGRSGRVVAGLGRDDVAEIHVRASANRRFTETITLEPGHTLSPQAIAGLHGVGAAALLGGRVTGYVHVLSPHLVEITGLTRNESAELRRLLG
jgi:anti-sigma factor RsiW